MHYSIITPHKASAVVQLLLLPFISHVAFASDLDTGFDPNANNVVNAIAIQADRKILAVGSFSSIGGGSRNGIARLNTNGSLDSTFNYNESVAGSVLSLAVQDDGKVLVGGAFITTSGPSRRRIARLENDGTLDTDFAAIVLSGEGQSINSIALQADGKIIIAGDFSAVQGTGDLTSSLRSNIARLNSDGSLDDSFTPSINAFVNSVVVQPDGKILVGGGFSLVTGSGEMSATARNRVARLDADGSLDATFDPNVNNTVRTMAVQANGKIIIGGGFTSVTGTGGAGPTTRNRVARLNVDGSLDTAFNPNSNGNVESVAIQADGAIQISGQFTTIAGQSYSRIARLQSNGDIDTSFDTGLTTNGFVWTIALQPDGNTLAGGFFNSVSNSTRNNIARIISEAAQESVIVSGDGLSSQWLRGGTAPEIFAATVEASIDSVNWSMPIDGTRNNDGWVFNGLDIQQEVPTDLRFRGYYGNSRSIAETIQSVTLLPENPDDGSFCFPIKAANTQTAVVCL